MSDKQYEEHVEDFIDRMRAALERKRSIKIEDLQGSGAGSDARGSGMRTGEGGSKCRNVPE